MNNISFDWSSTLDDIEMYTIDGQNVEFSTKLAKWRPFPIFPSCQSLDVTEFIDFEKFQPRQLQFNFNTHENIRIIMKIEEKNKDSQIKI